MGRIGASIEPGDKVALSCPNLPLFPVAYYRRQPQRRSDPHIPYACLTKRGGLWTDEKRLLMRR